MEDRLTVEELFWLERLMVLHSGESVGDVPASAREALLRREFAHLRGGELEISFEAIRHAMARR